MTPTEIADVLVKAADLMEQLTRIANETPGVREEVQAKFTKAKAEFDKAVGERNV